MFTQHLFHGIENEPKLFYLCLNPQQKILANKQFGASLHVFELHLREQTIRNHQQILVESPKLQRAEADVFNSPGLFADLTKITSLHCLVHQQRDSTYKVVQFLLCSQRYRQTSDTESSQSRSHIQSKQRKCSDYCDYEYHD